MSGRRRLNESGFTLIEVILALGLFALVAVAFSGILDIGINEFKLSCWWSSCGATATKGGVTDTQAGARDVSSLELQLSSDVSRAVCIRPGGGSTRGLCPSNPPLAFSLPAACNALATATICVSWPTSAGTCHTAVYSGSGSVISRKEYSNASLIAAGQTFTTDGVQTSITVVPPPASSNIFSTTIVLVSLTSLGARGVPLSGTVALHPVVTNPVSSVSTSPC